MDTTVPVGSIDLSALTREQRITLSLELGKAVHAWLVGHGLTRADVLDLRLCPVDDGVEFDPEGTHLPINEDNWDGEPLDENTRRKAITAGGLHMNTDLAKYEDEEIPEGGYDWPGGVYDEAAVVRTLPSDHFDFELLAAAVATASGDYGQIDRVAAGVTALLFDSLTVLGAELQAKAAAGVS